MSKLALKISLPIILSGIFAITIFMALNYENLNEDFYIILLLLTLFTFFFGLATGQNLSSPIQELLDTAQDLKGGKLSSRVSVGTRDELEQLGKAFNQLAEELQSSEGENEKIAKSVDIKVRAKTMALQETINSLEQKIQNRTVELERLMDELKKLQEEAKNKGMESEQLKREFEELKLKLVKSSKPKLANKPVNNTNRQQESDA